MYKVTLLPGDGIGPEIINAAKRCVAATGIKIKWEEYAVGEGAIKEYGSPLPECVLASIRKNKVCLKGPIITPIGSGFRSVNVALRQALDLYVCLRPTKSYDGILSPYKNVDIVIMRENTEDLYAGIEFEKDNKNTKELINWLNGHQDKIIREDSAISIKSISDYATRRIVNFAFEYAIKNNRKKITVVHKANIMKATDGLFLNAARQVLKKYEGKVEFQDVIVDNLSMQLVKKPQDFDILVLPNLYGDIISDLCAGLIGGLGIAPGANIGDGLAVFEPVHGAAPKYKGLNKVNPTAVILSACLMLRHLGCIKEAKDLENAVASVLKEGKKVTYDLKAKGDELTAVGTKEMADAIIENLKK